MLQLHLAQRAVRIALQSALPHLMEQLCRTCKILLRVVLVAGASGAGPGSSDRTCAGGTGAETASSIEGSGGRTRGAIGAE